VARKFHAPFASAQLHQICKQIATAELRLSAHRDIDARALRYMLRELRLNIDALCAERAAMVDHATGNASL
jgi:hypothetical protein